MDCLQMHRLSWVSFSLELLHSAQSPELPSGSMIWSLRLRVPVFP